MKFSEVIGHEDAKSALRAMADSGRIPHAIMLHGPAGIGKTRLARAFMQYVGCTRRSGGDSCGVCPSCRQTSSLNNPDIHYVYPVLKKDNRKVSADYAEEWRRMLSEHDYMQPEAWMDIIQAGNSQPLIYVDESEEITRSANMAAYTSDYKFYLVWLPEKLKVEAANKLLKLVEEPFPDTVFILVSNDPGGVLQTISSRTRRLELNRLPDAEIAGWMQRHGAPPEEAARIAALAQGNAARAQELRQGSGESAEFADYFMAAMRNAYAMNAVAIKELADRFAGLGREKGMRLLDYFSRQVRENFILNLKVPPLNSLTPGEEQFGSRFAPFIHAGNVEHIIGEIDRARRDIGGNANAKLIWFDFLLRLMRHLRRKPPV